MNSYELSRRFFDWCFENPEKVNTNHVAIYFFAIEHCNRLGWRDKFGFPTQMVMDAIGIKKHQTYIKYFNDLCLFGFFKLVQKSQNQYSANIISLQIGMPKNGKALDKAIINHTAKQTGIIGQSNSSIDKPYNYINQEQCNTDSEILTHTPTPEIEKKLPAKGRLGIDYRPAYKDLDEEFRKMYSEVFWRAYLAINKHISENCLFLKDWENQITIKDFKVIFDKIQDEIFKIEDVRQALLDLDGSKQAKEKYNSVYHGLNVYINTILRSKNR